MIVYFNDHWYKQYLILVPRNIIFFAVILQQYRLYQFFILVLYQSLTFWYCDNLSPYLNLQMKLWCLSSAAVSKFSHWLACDSPGVTQYSKLTEHIHIFTAAASRSFHLTSGAWVYFYTIPGQAMCSLSLALSVDDHQKLFLTEQNNGHFWHFWQQVSLKYLREKFYTVCWIRSSC